MNYLVAQDEIPNQPVGIAKSSLIPLEAFQGREWSASLSGEFALVKEPGEVNIMFRAT
jgi:hypothetical protein